MLLIVRLWEDCISNLSLSEDYNNLILAHFPEGQFPDKFHQYLDTVRSMESSDNFGAAVFGAVCRLF